MVAEKTRPPRYPALTHSDSPEVNQYSSDENVDLIAGVKFICLRISIKTDSNHLDF